VPARAQHAVQELEVADPAVRRQVVEAARVAATEIHLLVGVAVLRPGDGRGRQVDGRHLETLLREIQGITDVPHGFFSPRALILSFPLVGWGL
jgi:hypothetical protein